MNSKYQKHEPSHEKFLKNADDFCVYTIRLLKDENVCPKSARWLGAEEIVKITQRFHTEVHRANNIKVTNAEEKKMRRAAQVSAYSYIATLGEKMSFNARIYGMKVNILSGWLTRKGEIQSWLSGWIRSDEKRYEGI